MARTLEDLAVLGKAELERLFDAGSAPDPDSLAGYEFRGYNQPFITKLGGFQKFRKGFYRQGGELWGYNVPVEQGPLSAPWRCLPSDDQPKRFGYYSVRPSRASDKLANALLLDYSDGDNKLWEGSFLRDYLRQVDPGDPDLLIGKAYTALGGAQLMPSYFIIQRDREAPGEVKHRPRQRN